MKSFPTSLGISPAGCFLPAENTSLLRDEALRLAVPEGACTRLSRMPTPLRIALLDETDRGI